MKLVNNNKSFLFSNTEIPDVFFTEYLPAANGEHLKVFFYVLFLSKFNTDIKLTDLSKTLGINFPVVQEAIKYWENLGVLVKTPDGYNLTSIQEIELSKLYSPKVSLSPETIEKNSESQNRAKVIESINSQFFSGTMSPSWYADILMWFDKYKFSEEVMLALFNYCYENKALHRNYIQTVADGWNKENIKNFNELEEYFEKREKINLLSKKISQKLKLSRKLTSYEEEYLIKWDGIYKYDIEIIELALKRASSKNSINFEYIDTLLTDWHNKELTTSNEILSYLESFKQKEIKSTPVKKVSYEYTQSTFDNWDSLYDN